MSESEDREPADSKTQNGSSKRLAQGDVWGLARLDTMRYKWDTSQLH